MVTDLIQTAVSGVFLEKKSDRILVMLSNLQREGHLPLALPEDQRNYILAKISGSEVADRNPWELMTKWGQCGLCKVDRVEMFWNKEKKLGTEMAILNGWLILERADGEEERIPGNTSDLVALGVGLGIPIMVDKEVFEAFCIGEINTSKNSIFKDFVNAMDLPRLAP
jgi:hypothetical protein